MMKKTISEQAETICYVWGLSSESWAAIIGALFVGGFSILVHWLIHYWSTKRDRNLRNKRKILLKILLDDGKYEWRTMKTLSGVIGASRDETASLLIELEARASTKEKDVWAYIKNQPLDKVGK